MLPPYNQTRVIKIRDVAAYGVTLQLEQSLVQHAWVNS